LKYIKKKLLTKAGVEFEIREAFPEDAQRILDYVTIIFSTSPYILTQTSDFHFNLKLQEDWLLNLNNSLTGIFLIAIWQDKVIGNIDLRGSTLKRNRHCVGFGMSVLPDWQSQGVGKLLLKETILFCQKHPIIKKLELGVIEANHRAIKLYESCGFNEEGRSIKGFLSDEGKYLDELKMGLWTD
jgi:RimJ/RimL family protein N-acetyltransferase